MSPAMVARATRSRRLLGTGGSGLRWVAQGCPGLPGSGQGLCGVGPTSGVQGRPRVPGMPLEVPVDGWNYLASSLGANLVAYANPLAAVGAAICSDQLDTGPLPVVQDWTYMPSMATMARRPFLISLSWSSDRVVGSSPKPRGSKASPG